MLIIGVAALSALISVLSTVAKDAFSSLDWLWMLPATFVAMFVLLGILAFLFLLLMCLIVDMEKPQEEASRFYRVLTFLYAQAAINLLQMRVHKTGMEKLPQGRFLLVCNHIHDLDPVTLLACFHKSQLAFISKRENDARILAGPLMHKILCQPINRENDREALKTILKCISIIREDKASVAVFPEGYTSLDGLLHPFRHGVFKIAQKAGVPVVVCTLQNTNKAFSNAPKLKPTHVHLHLLDVIPVEEVKAVTAVELGNRIHQMMAEDLGPDLVLKETT